MANLFKARSRLIENNVNVMNIIKKIYRGAGYLEGFGNHPGTGFMLLYIVVAGIVGAGSGSLWGFIGGSIMGALPIIPMWMYGCVSRYDAYERCQQRTFDILAKSS